MGTGAGTSTPGPAPSTWRSPSSAPAATSPTGSSSPGDGPNGPSWRWWPSATSKGSRPAGSTTWSSPWGSTGSPSPRSPSWPSPSTRSVTAFRNRPLDAGPYTYVWLDALTQKVREGGRIVNVAVVVATGVNADGHREILGSRPHHHRGRRGLDGVPARPRRPRALRGRAGGL